MQNGQHKEAQYKLCAELTGHAGDVKAVVAASDDVLFSVSRDSTGRTWHRGSNGFGAGSVFKGQAGYVNSVAWIAPSAKHANGLLVTGGQDGLISIYDPLQPDEPLYVLVGHSGNVCTLDVDASGAILSGSWDSTAKVWEELSCTSTLQGHKSSVWAVLFLRRDKIVTASADKTIRLWQGSKMIKEITAHRDCVRGLTKLSDGGFASCANDGEIMTFDEAGQRLAVLNGHESYVYSIKEVHPGMLVSSGEDRTARIWKNNRCIQTLTHPAISIWSVAVCPNGDLVSGASDNIVRVFSRSPERQASAETIRAFQAKVSQQARPSQEIGNIQKDSLPGTEALIQRGKKEGQVIMIRNGNVVEAHQWTEAEQAWTKVGEVVDAIGSDRKQLYEGKEYDYVFDVDIAENAPPLKLPYNVNQNPFAAAQDFVRKNELPDQYVDEVAAFIVKNTKGTSLDTPQYSDPFTGSGRYIPGANAQRAASATSQASNSMNTQSKVLPHRAFLFLKQGNTLAIKQKLSSLNAALKSSEHKILSLNPTQEERLLKLADAPHAFDDPEYSSVLVKVVTQWPESDRFPGLDLARLAAGTSPAFVKLDSPYGDAVETLLGAAQIDTTKKLEIVSKAKEVNTMLCLRTFANMFSASSSIELMLQHAEQILGWIALFDVYSLKSTITLASATILLNYSIISLEGRLERHLAILQAAASRLCHEKVDSESLYRALVAFGNTLYVSSAKTPEASLKTEWARRLDSLLQRARDETRLRDILSEIRSKVQ